MKQVLPTLLLCLAMLPPAIAQQNTNDHSAHHPAAGPAAPLDGDATQGEVRKIDKEAARLTLKHGEIRNLEMPPMTMIFTVKDASVLDKLKAGDKVRFKAVNEAGKYVITDIQVVQ
jgi:Cu(I)/Ag(I) efflux system protein CusF